MPSRITIPFAEFTMPSLEKQDTRRLPRKETPAPSLATRHDRIEKRNRVMTARYYYWTELKRRRFDDTVRMLAENEFFVEERTITNTLLANDDYFRDLCSAKASGRKLKSMFPGFDWD